MVQTEFDRRIPRHVFLGFSFTSAMLVLSVLCNIVSFCIHIPFFLVAVNEIANYSLMDCEILRYNQWNCLSNSGENFVFEMGIFRVTSECFIISF